MDNNSIVFTATNLLIRAFLRGVGHEPTIDVSSLAGGTYLVRISSDNTTAVRKLVVK